MPQNRVKFISQTNYMYSVYSIQCFHKENSSDGFGVQVLTIFEATSWHVVQPDSSTGMLRGRNTAAKRGYSFTGRLG